MVETPFRADYPSVYIYRNAFKGKTQIYPRLWGDGEPMYCHQAPRAILARMENA